MSDEPASTIDQAAGPSCTVVTPCLRISAERFALSSKSERSRKRRLPPANQRQEKFNGSDVERHRCRRKESIFPAELQELARRRQEVHEVAMLDFHSLRFPRAARGEQDVGEAPSSRAHGGTALPSVRARNDDGVTFTGSGTAPAASLRRR